MNSLLKFMLVANLLLSVYWAQCPVGVTYTDILWSEGYSYSSITNLKIVNGYVWSDNSWTYTVSNGLISAVDYTMISKFDGQFNTIWGKALIGPVQQEAFQVTSDEKYIIFVPNQVSSWTVVKLNTNDGSFNLQNNLTPIVQWQSIQLSTDGASVYLAGYSNITIFYILS